MTNSTINDNTALGGAGGVNVASGTLTLRSTIIANSPFGADCAGVISSSGYSLDSDGSCNLSGTGDLSGANPMLGPLQDNGGPTLTHALLTGSPAIDAVPVTDCTDPDGSPVATDQRGVVRPKGPACDIGAFELFTAPIPRAETSISLHQDAADQATGLNTNVTRTLDPSTGNESPVLLAAFQTQTTYVGSCVNILDVRPVDFDLSATRIDNIAGLTAFNGVATDGIPAPATLGFTETRLVGNATQPCSLNQRSVDLTDPSGDRLDLAPGGLDLTLLRGDARADGNVTIADAMFIAQYLVGSRDACTTVVDTSCLHSVNAASVRQDGVFDQKTITDALFIEQYLVGSRDEFYNLLP